MSVLNIPNTFITGTTIQAAPFNANFTAIQTAVNSIDNTNIGAAGIFASQLIPTTAAQATFGGLVGYKFYPATASAVPLTISGFTGQSVDLLDVTLTSGGTNAFKISSTGAATFGFALSAAGLTSTAGVAVGGALTGATTGAFSSTLSAAGLTSTAGVAVGGALTGATTGAFSSTISSSVAYGSAFVLTFPSLGSSGYTAIGAANTSTAGVTGSILNVQNQGVAALLGLDTSGNLGVAGALVAAKTVQGSSNSSTIAYVPPVYTAAGAATASTLHGVFGSTSITFSSGTIAAGGASLTGAAQFASGATYGVAVSSWAVASGTANSPMSFNVQSATATSFVIQAQQASSSTGTITVYWFAIGY